MNVSLAQPRILVDHEALTGFCERWDIVRLEFFGSVLREDFGPGSDVDVMVSFQNPLAWSLIDLEVMERELTQLLGRKADLAVRQGVESSRNSVLRRLILDGARDVVAR